MLKNYVSTSAWKSLFFIACLVNSNILAQKIIPTPGFSKYAYESPTNSISQFHQLSDGKILTIGKFEYFKNVAPYLFRLHADGSRDESFNATMYESAEKPLAVLSTGKILTGGIVSEGGVSGFRFFRLTEQGALDASYNPGRVIQVPGITQFQQLALAHDDKIYMMVVFAGTIENKLIRLTSDGMIDPDFTSGVSNNCSIQFIVPLPDGKVLVRGCIFEGLMRLNENGSIDPTFQNTKSITGYSIRSVTVRPDGKIWVSGIFSHTTNGVTRTNLVLLNANGTVDESYTPTPDLSISNPISAKSLPNSHIQLMGSFKLNGLTYPMLTLDAQGIPVKSFSFPSSITTVNDAHILSSGKALLGIAYPNLNKAPPLSFIQLMNEDGTLDNSYVKNSGFNNYASATSQEDGKIIMIGKFSHFNQTPIPGYITRLNADGTLDETFNANKQGFDAHRSQSLYHLPDGKFLCANANFYNNELVGPLFRMNADGTRDKDFHDSFLSPVSGAVIACHVTADRILVAAGNVPNYQLLKLKMDGSLEEDFIKIPIPFVSNITEQADGKFILSGETTSTPKQGYITRFNSDLTPDPGFNSGSGFNGKVTGTVITPDNKILVYGQYTHYNGTKTQFLTRLHATGELDTSFHGPFENFEPGSGGVNIVRAELLSNNKILLIGNFVSSDGKNTSLMILNENGSADQDQQLISFEGNLLGENNHGTSRMYGAEFQNNRLLVTGNFIRLKDGDYQSLLASLQLQCEEFTINLPNETSVCIGNSLHLEATEQRNDLIYTWTKEDQLAGNTREFTITNFQPEHIGNYTISVTDGCNNTKTQTISVELQSELKIIREPEDVIAHAGDPVALHVEAEGSDLTYNWVKNGTTVSNTAHVMLQKISLKDAGIYEVTVNASCGEPEKRSAQVTVLAKSEEAELPAIYPNPFNTYFTIKFATSYIGVVDISIIDSMGRLRKKIQVNKTEGLNSIDVEGLADLESGAFTIKIHAEREYYQKLILNR